MKTLPDPIPETLAQRDAIIAAMRVIVGDRWVLTEEEQLRAYECDGFSDYRQLPLIVVLPASEQEIANILCHCQKHGVRIVPRGAGTGISGGATPLADAITISVMRMKRVVEIDIENECAVVEPGVTNQAISDACRGTGFFYAPDPSSQFACSIGGNVAENAGGLHCLKYGMTTHNVIGVRLAMLDGSVVGLGGKSLEQPGYDLLGVVNGSEGLLGIVTEVTVRLTRAPGAVETVLIGFPTLEAGGDCVAAIIADGIVPAALEMADRLSVNAIEDAVSVGFPRDVEGLLICEIDGAAEEVEDVVSRVEAIAKRIGANHIERAASPEDRARFWQGRKSIFAAYTSISPDFLTMDGAVPRRKIAEVIHETARLAEEYGLQVANVFHAGDGNIHPAVLYDASVDGELERAEALSADILRACVAAGGVLSGEHGVGLEKRDLMGEMFTEADLDQQQRLKCAFDADHLLNPGKVFPTLRRCGELKPLEAKAQVARFPDLARY